METEFRALLTGDAAITALVGSRIYWNAIPQGTVDPCVVMYVVSRQADIHHGGANGLNSWLVQIDVRSSGDSEPYSAALAVRDAIVARLHAKRLSEGKIAFKAIVLRDEQHTSEKPQDKLFHRIRLDFEVWSGDEL